MSAESASANQPVRRSDLCIAFLVLLVCVLVKLHYRAASAAELRWLLAPTASIGGLVTGYAFRFESDAGYVSRELGLAIAPACAGANYLVIALASLVLGFVSCFDSVRGKLSWFAASAGIAYVATLFTNSLRISLAVWCRPLAAALEAEERAQVHRAQGVLVYLFSLLVLYAVTDARLRKRPAARASRWLPLACYLGVTLLVPLGLGARLNPEFSQHALVVLGLTAAAVAVSSALGYTRRA